MAAAPLLSTLPEAWPLEHGSEERLAIFRFIALHLVRSPRWRAQHDLLAARSIAQRRAEWKEALGESFDQFLERLRADDFAVETILGQVQTTSSLLGSLHWTLLRFPKPMLATSDQPVAPIPLLAPRAVVPIAPQLTNLVGNIEFRIAVDPQHALLMCWHDAPDRAAPVDLGFQEAVDLNAAVRVHAHAQAYWQPGARPPWIAPPEAVPTSRPISTALYDGYSTATAIRSTRMRETRKILEQMIESQVHNEVRTIQVVEQKRAA